MQNGICESPTEYPGFGRFGCIPDCGLYSKTTTLTIDLQTFLHMSKSDAIAWDLSNINLSDDPKFTYNIFSDTMGDFIFANDMSPNEKKLVDVPDGNLTLFLYQTAEMSPVIDPQQIYNYIGVLDSTLPPRTATNDFAYGDPRELIATSTVILDAITNNCSSGSEPIAKCVKSVPQDILLRVLGSYGLAGTITASNGGRGRDYLVNLPFCSAVPNRTAGIGDASNVAFIRSAGVICPSRRWLDSSKELSDDASLDYVIRSDREDRKSSEENQLPKPAQSNRRAQDAGCSNWVSGQVDCSTESPDPGCPNYWTQVCKAGLPPYFVLPTYCKNHSDCDSASRAPFCASSGVCEPCNFCQVDQDDSIDSVCPQKACPGSGGWPRCISGQSLTKKFGAGQCQSTVSFSVWKYHSPNEEVNLQPLPSDKVRWVTPSNMLVGPVIVTQRRELSSPCKSQKKISVQDFFQQYACRTGQLDGAPYGIDPSFLPSSSIYNGKLQMSQFYNETEIIPSANSGMAGVNVTTRQTALGFFPQQYQRSAKQFMPGDFNLFRLFFDGRITTSQSDTMVTYMSDGGFIDDKTQSVSIEFITFSPTLSKFSVVGFIFNWQVHQQVELIVCLQLTLLMDLMMLLAFSVWRSDDMGFFNIHVCN